MTDRGVLRWEYQSRDQVRSKLLALGGHVIFTDTGGHVQSHDRTSGTQQWRIRLDSGNASAQLLHHREWVFTVDDTGRVHSIVASSGTFDRTADVDAVPAGLIVSSTGKIFVADRRGALLGFAPPKTGEVVRRIALPRGLSNVPVSARNSLYVADRDGIAR